MIKSFEKFGSWYTERDALDIFGAPKFRQGDFVKVKENDGATWCDFFVILYLHHSSDGYTYHLGKITKDFDIISIDANRLRGLKSPTNVIDRWISADNLTKVTEEEKNKLETGLNAKKYNL
jgi:hypothetical protein